MKNLPIACSSKSVEEGNVDNPAKKIKLEEEAINKVSKKTLSITTNSAESLI